MQAFQEKRFYLNTVNLHNSKICSNFNLQKFNKIPQSISTTASSLITIIFLFLIMDSLRLVLQHIFFSRFEKPNLDLTGHVNR